MKVFHSQFPVGGRASRPPVVTPASRLAVLGSDAGLLRRPAAASGTLAPPTASRHPRGVVLIMVAAILVLLALMGTIYILAASNDTAGLDASTNALNLSFAQQSVLNIVRGEMVYQTMDGAGNFLGPSYGFYTGGVTYPKGATVEVAPAPPTVYVPTYYQEVIAPTSAAPPSADWQQIAAPQLFDTPETIAAYAPGKNPAGTLVWSTSAPYIVFQAVANDPTSAPGTLASGSSSTPAWQPIQAEPWLSNGLVVNNLYPWRKLAYPTATYSVLTPQSYDPSDGQYDLALPGSPNASVVLPAVNLIVGTETYDHYGPPDAYWNLLPYSSPDGTRYRFALRIIDTNSMANLNVGSVGSLANAYGSYFTGVPLDDSNIFDSSVVNGNTFPDAPLALQSGAGTVIGRQGQGSWAGPYNVANWQNALLTADLNSGGLQLFGVGTEPELRSYGIFGGGFAGAPFTPRSAVLGKSATTTMWPNTLGEPPPSNPLLINRLYYTCYSYDRSLRPEADPATPFTLNGVPTVIINGAKQNIWPTFPEKIDVNAPANQAAGSANQANSVAATATALAQAMIGCGYTAAESLAFAVNYMNYAYDSGTISGTSPNFTYTPNASGPCFATAGAGSGGNTPNGGLSVRGTTDTDFAGAGDLQVTSAMLVTAGITIPSGVTDPVVSGYSAQPFIEEVAIDASNPGPPGGVQFTNCAVVLYNPYGVTLSLAGWTLGLYDPTSSTYTQTVDLGTDFPGGIAPKSYDVVLENSSGGFTVGAGAQQFVDPSLQLQQPAVGQTSGYLVVLARLFTPAAGHHSGKRVGWYKHHHSGGSSTSNLPMDSFDYTAVAAEAAGAGVTATDYYSERYNSSAGPGWACASAANTPPQSTPAPLPYPLVVGENQGGNATNVAAAAIPLYDRFADPGGLPGYTAGTEPSAGQAFLNIGDFNSITRLISVSGYSATAGDYVPVQMISQTIQNLGSTPNTYEATANPSLEYEANARFDFLYDPSATTQPDARAIAMLDYITFDSAASDATVNDGTTPNIKLRVPGRINVNTASQPVLQAMADSLNDTSLASGYQAQIVTAITGLRARTGSGGIPVVNFTSIPGSGINSKAELLDGLQGIGASSSPPATLQQRDEAWADVYNMCTVRSDTFAVYGLMQALTLNAIFSGTLPSTANTTDWYNASQDPYASTGPPTPNPNLISTDPASTNAEFILTGQQRFIAIIDRSLSNPNPTTPNGVVPQPRVVAIKVLPQ